MIRFYLAALWDVVLAAMIAGCVAILSYVMVECVKQHIGW